MFILDIETLDTESTAVVLSAALLFVDDPSIGDKEMVKKCLYVKFDAKEQIKEYNRTCNKDTINWWKSQPENVKKYSYIKSEKDVPLLEGIKKLKDYVEKHDSEKQSQIFARGAFDTIIIDSLFKSAGQEPLYPFWKTRDIRTFIDCMYNSNNGYTRVDYDGYDFNKYPKHNPICDVIQDTMQILHGVVNE